MVEVLYNNYKEFTLLNHLGNLKYFFHFFYKKKKKVEEKLKELYLYLYF